MNALRGIPVNDVVYAMPVLVWLISFGLTRLFPRAAFQKLCLRFPLAPTPPTMSPADMDLPENVEALAAAMAAAAGAASPSSTAFTGPSRGEDERTFWYAAAGAQRRRYLAALLHFPLRWFSYWKDVLTTCDDVHGGGGSGAGYGGRVLASLLSCFTALCVHANRAALVSSILCYLNALSAGKQCDFRYEAVGDMAGAVLGATIANFILLASLKSLNAEGMPALSRAAVVSNRPILRWMKLMLLPSLRIAVLMLSSSSFTFRFGYTAGSSNSSPSRRATAGSAPNTAETATPIAAAGEEQPARDGDYAPSAWARAAGAVEVTTPKPCAGDYLCRLPPIAHVCGGEGLSYAFSGFRFVYRRDVAQLRGAAWSYWMDSFQSYLSVWLRRGAAAPTAASATSSSWSGATTTTSNPFTSVEPATGDMYFSTASSDELSQHNIVAFLSGCAVGFVALQGPLALQVARKTPLLSCVVNAISPPPLPAIAIPDGLMDATITDLGVVRLYYHPHRSHHHRHRAALHTPSGSPDNNAATEHVESTAVEDEALGQGRDSSDSDSGDGVDSANGSIVLDTRPTLERGRDENGGDGGGDGEAARAVRAAFGQGSSGPVTTGRDAQGHDYMDIPVPPSCFCPITRCLMSDPVKTVDGFTYDREAITAWLRRRATSPMTNLPLDDAALVTDREVYAQVQAIVRAYTQFATEHHQHDRPM